MARMTKSQKLTRVADGEFKVERADAVRMAQAGTLTAGRIGGSTTRFVFSGILMNDRVWVWQCGHDTHRSSTTSRRCAEQKIAELAAEAS